MQKYRTILILGLKNALEYRAALFTWILVDFMTLTSALFLWTGVFRSQSVVGSYQLNQIILYYFLIPIVGAFVSAHISDRLPRKIKNGEITQDLVKPYAFLWGFIINQISIKNIQSGIKIPLYFGIGLYLFNTFQLTLKIPNFLLGLGITLIAYAVHLALDTTISLFAFWFDDTWSLSLLKYVSLMIFGGLSFPLDLIPSEWKPLYIFLPFDLIYYFPVSVMMGKLDSIQMIGYFIKAIIWFSFFMFLINRLWRQGINKYGAYGQ